MTTHIVVDVRKANDSGVGTYIRHVVPRVAALEPAWHFTLLGHARRLAGSAWAQLPHATFVDCGAPNYSIREQLQLAARIPTGADVFWSPHYTVPLFTRTPLVVTVHDLAHLRLPEHTGRALRHAYARAMFGAVQARASEVLFVSRFTHDEYRALVGVPRASVVTGEGVDESWFAPRRDPAPIASPYFLFVGNLKPHKNVRVVLEAMQINGARMNASLVLVGRTESRTRDDTLAPLLAQLGPRVVMAGEVDDATLRRYVQHATALVLPSLYEGFGLPPLEAMASGTPSLVSTAGSLPEVCGDAALYFEPRDAGELARLMARITHDTTLRSEMSARGKAHARTFDWGTTAVIVRDALLRVVKGRAS